MRDTHLGGCYLDTNDGNTFMPDVWERLIKDYEIKSVVDVGCGAGWNTKWFLDHGIDAWGIEGWPEAVKRNQMPAERIIQHDYTNGPLPLRAFDLGWSSEFVEHVEERFIPNWMATLKNCRYVCMTYAVPGQGGYHHVCERDLGFWYKQFTASGFEYDTEETVRLRKTDQGGGWGRKTLTFFRNKILAGEPMKG